MRSLRGPPLESRPPAVRGIWSQGQRMAETMRAVVRDVYGSVDVLRIEETAKPVADEREVLVRVLAAGVDQGVWHLMVGMPYAMRLAGFGLRAPKNPLLGYDVAGRVEAVGADAGAFRPGDAVFGTCRGSFADYAVARADRLAGQAGRGELRTGRRHPDLRIHRPAGGSQSRQGQGRSARPDHRCGRRRRDVLSADREGGRGRGHRCLQHRENRAGALDRC